MAGSLRKHTENLKETYDVEQALDEADRLAEDSDERMTHEEMFQAIKGRITIPFILRGINENLTVDICEHSLSIRELFIRRNIVNLTLRFLILTNL